MGISRQTARTIILFRLASSFLGTTAHRAIEGDFVMAVVLRLELISELVQIHRP